MKIAKTESEDTITLTVEGKLSAATSEEFDAMVESVLDSEKKIILDFQDVSYLASAGLRVLVSAQKKLALCSRTLSIINICDNVREVFEITGLDDVFELK
jgi:anti-sigma B factor antagonist